MWINDYFLLILTEKMKNKKDFWMCHLSIHWSDFFVVHELNMCDGWQIFVQFVPGVFSKQVTWKKQGAHIFEGSLNDFC